MDGYSAQQVAKMLGVAPGRLRSRLRAYWRAGLLSTERGERGRLRLSFQDLLLLRTAEGLVAERVPPRRVLRALKKLRARLPEEQPITGVPLSADGDRIVAHEGAARWQPESGQVLFSFPDDNAATDGAAISPCIPSSVQGAPAPDVAAPRAAGDPADGGVGGGDGVEAVSADDLYRIAATLEETDPVHAAHTYRQVLALDPSHADGHVNLGRLLHEAGEIAEAEAHYRATIALRPDDATAAFNLAVAIEDQGRSEEALEQYERAVAIDGRNPDAHYNAARLYEKSGKLTAAIRHLRAYRELVR
jgi:tetratricopeptide (TPR) repeat protein